MTIKHFPDGVTFFSADEDFFNERFFSITKERGYFRCYFYIYEIVNYTLPQNIETEHEEEEEITPPIIKTFKEDKCIICLENKPDIFYENCRHIPTCSSCEEVKNLENVLSADQ